MYWLAWLYFLNIYFTLKVYYYLILCISSGVRPFGVSLLMAGWDEDEERPYLYQCDPSVSGQILEHMFYLWTTILHG